jgi:hypothetical protein
MKVIKSKIDLPTWFKLNNYDSVTLLSDNDLTDQIAYRASLLTYLDYGFTKDSDFTDLHSRLKWALITKGNPIVSEVFQLTHDDELVPAMPWTNAVKPLKALNAITFTHTLIKEDRLIANKERLTPIDYSAYSEYFDLVDLNNNHRLAHMVINLNENSDKTILSDIKKLLPHWREVLEINEPTENIYSKPSHFKKIVDYKIIPLLDLKIWSLLEDKKIPHRVLTVALYPNGEKGETELKQTVLPFTEIILSDDYRLI